MKVATDGKLQYLCYLWKKGDAATAWKFMRETFPSLFTKDIEERFEVNTWEAPTHKGSTRLEREQLHVKGKELRTLLSEMKEFDREWARYVNVIKACYRHNSESINQVVAGRGRSGIRTSIRREIRKRN